MGNLGDDDDNMETNLELDNDKDNLWGVKIKEENKRNKNGKKFTELNSGVPQNQVLTMTEVPKHSFVYKGVMYEFRNGLYFHR
jgi:hypothetical protein